MGGARYRQFVFSSFFLSILINIHQNYRGEGMLLLLLLLLSLNGYILQDQSHLKAFGSTRWPHSHRRMVSVYSE
jgi:hypothetical protein